MPVVDALGFSTPCFPATLETPVFLSKHSLLALSVQISEDRKSAAQTQAYIGSGYAVTRLSSPLRALKGGHTESCLQQALSRVTSSPGGGRGEGAGGRGWMDTDILPNTEPGSYYSFLPWLSPFLP